MITKYTVVKSIIKAELGKIIDPLIISHKAGEPVDTDYEFPASAQLIDDATDRHQGIEKGPDTLDFCVVIDQMLEDLNEEQHRRTAPDRFYQFLDDYYVKMAGK